MKIPQIKGLSALSDADYAKWKRQAYHNGYITPNQSFSQLKRAYEMEQLINARLDPNLSLEEANNRLAVSTLYDLYQKGQVGEEVTPLIKLYDENPVLAANLTRKLFDSGYMTQDEINKRAKTPLDFETDDKAKIAKSMIANASYNYFTDKRGAEKTIDSQSDAYDAFIDYYGQAVDKQKETAAGRALVEEFSDDTQKQLLEDTRHRYLKGTNQSLMKGINQEIEKFQDYRATKLGEERLKKLNAYDVDPSHSNAIAAEFNRLVNKRKRDDGTDYNGAGWYHEFKDSAFDDFGLKQQKDVVAKYSAIYDLYGEQKADEWLDKEMQTWVSDHQSIVDRALNTAKANTITVVNNVGPRMLSSGLWAIFKGLSTVADWVGQDYWGNVYNQYASIISTGKTTDGQHVNEVAPQLSLSDNGALFWLRGDYIDNVEKYNAWTIKEQKRVEANNGINRNAQYVLKPGQDSPEFYELGELQDVFGMTSQIVSQVIALWLSGGGKAGASLAQLASRGGAKALLTKEAAKTTLTALKETAQTAVPIAQSYAFNTYQQTYQGAKEMGMSKLQNDIISEFTQYRETDEYKKNSNAEYLKWLEEKNKKGKGKDGSSAYYFASPQSRAAFQAEYDQKKFIEFSQQEKYAQKEETLNTMAHTAASGAYMTSFTGEFLKYGLLNATLQPLKVLKNPNKVLASELKTNAYGKLTQDAVGKFENKGINLLGIKKWHIDNPKIADRVMGTYKVARNAIVAGGLSNYTDEMTTGFAMGFGLSNFNSEYLRRYDPKAYAETWHGGSAVGQFFDAIDDGIAGGIQAGLTEQAWHAFEIGAVGGILSPRLGGNKEMRQRYAKENAEYLESHPLTTKKDKAKYAFKRIRQGFNTWATGSIGEYEAYRMGRKEQAAHINNYNKAIEEREELQSELASLSNTIARGMSAQVQNDFAAAAVAQDHIAMKLAYNQHKLSNNPLHQISNQQTQANIAQLAYIAQGAVSEEEKERLIIEALNTSQLNKQGPVTQQQRDAVWADIQETARRTSQFLSDYYEAEEKLKFEDPKYDDPENYPLLTQTAELMAQQSRLARDIEQMSKDSGINIDPTSRGTYGQMTSKQKKILLKTANKTIDQLRDKRQQIDKQTEETQSKLDKEKDDDAKKTLEEQLLKQRIEARATERHIAELEQSIEQVNNNELLSAHSGLSNDATVIYDMLANPEQYSAKQQKEIRRFKNKLGTRAETYVKEMAKLQDQMRDNEYASKTLRENPQDYLSFVTQYQNTKGDIRNEAGYIIAKENTFDKIAGLPKEDVGPVAALSLNETNFDEFLKRRLQVLSAEVTKYKELNKAFNTIRTALELSQNPLWKNVLDDVRGLLYTDAEYFVNNTNNGVVDMLTYLATVNIGNQDKFNLINSVTDSFKKATQVQASTTAYTEYRLSRDKEEAIQRANELYEKAKRDQEKAGEQGKEDKQKGPEPKQEPKQEPEKPADTPPEAKGPVEPKPKEKQPKKPEKEQGEEKEEKEGEPSQEGEQEEEEGETPDQPEQGGEIKKSPTEDLPQGVARDAEGELYTMTPEEQAEQLGLQQTPAETMVEDRGPAIQETTNQQEEVHGCYFNLYEKTALKNRDLVDYTDGVFYEWLQQEGINLGAIIDDELHNIIQVNPKIQLMKVRKSGKDAGVASTVFLVVEYTDEVAKHHLPENGGVITSGGKPYLIVGTMWNTTSQNGTPAAEQMLKVRNALQKKGVEYLTNNHNERFYVDPVMHTQVTTFYSGHIIDTVNGEPSSPRSLSDLIDEYNRSHTPTNSISLEDLGFGIITMKEGFYPVGPISLQQAKKHAPQQTADPSKYGQVYVLVKAANGETIPIFINPTTVSEINEDSWLSQRIDDCINQLMSPDFEQRLRAKASLCKFLCISSTITKRFDTKGILIGTEDIPTVSIVDGEEVLGTYDMKNFTKDGKPFSLIEFRDAIRQTLNPRINIGIMELAEELWVKRYDEAGALKTDSIKLGTFGSKYYVAPIDASTGQPVVAKEKAESPQTNNSDYQRAQYDPNMITVGGQIYVNRKGEWVNQATNQTVTDSAELTQILWSQKVLKKEVQQVFKQKNLRYYAANIDTDKPTLVAYNVITRKFEGVAPEFAKQIIDKVREDQERERANSAAKEILNKKTGQKQPDKQFTRPDIKLFSQNAWDNVTVTVTSNGFNHPTQKSRLWNSAKDLRSALNAEVGTTLNNGVKVVSRDEKGNTYVEIPNAKDGEVKSAIIFPTSGRGGDNYTAHFFMTLDNNIVKSLIQRANDMPGATTTELVDELNITLSPSSEKESPEPVKKNGFELYQHKEGSKYSIAEIMISDDIDIMDKFSRICTIIHAKIKAAKEGKLDSTRAQKWKDFNIRELESELKRIGIQSTNIDDIDSWIDNLENCE